MTVDSDPRWRYNAKTLQSILLNHCLLREDWNPVSVKLYGSSVSPDADAVWDALEAVNIEVKVDGQLVADAVDDAADAFYFDDVTSEFVIVSGDRDIHTAVDKIASRRGFDVHVWSWKNGLASEYWEQNEERVHVHLLDDHLEEIGFLEKTWKGDLGSIPRRSPVVLGGGLRAAEIEDSVDGLKLKYPVFTHQLEQNFGNSANIAKHLTLLLGPENSTRNTNDCEKAREKFLLDCKQGLRKIGLKVISFLEYSQKYLTPPSSPTSTSSTNQIQAFHLDMSRMPENRAIESSSDKESQSNDGFQEAVSPRDRKHQAKRGRQDSTGSNSRHHSVRCNLKMYCSHGLSCNFWHIKEKRDQFALEGPKKLHQTILCNSWKTPEGVPIPVGAH
ncbi:hypothetical protein QBC38DRAFT_547030 [Podospora fimiseda]|uniref:NYN domain-containing protein n=1 Tax=Podospora fimiseda TaxID=252190 RepID=A0AAN7BKU7_9PEZI|nr:hypothetical protein QBC38DRAFT_547030 [Podospora fimiseda]